ncbi:MAG: hypothetical protein M1815_001217 [Lichina confinis]|nr:MAG: hypothetical protein M1815_001217 [Lichina confinis]
MSIKECSKEASITTRRQSADEEDEKWEPEQGLWFRDDKEMELLNNARHRGNRNPGRFGANLKANFNELGGQFGAYVQRYFKPGRASPARGAVMPFGGRPMPLGI